MISYDFYCKIDTTTTFLKSPFNPSSANSQFFFFENEKSKNKNASNMSQPMKCNYNHGPKLAIDKRYRSSSLLRLAPPCKFNIESPFKLKYSKS